jgi:FMN reductase
MTPSRVVVVSAGLGAPSSTRLLADELGGAVAEALTVADVPVEVEVIELREMAHQVVDALLIGFPSAGLRPAVDAVLQADALVVVSPTFSASYSGLFKSFFDLFEADSLAGKPTLLAATGGTERHSLVLEHALRPLLTYLGASPVRTGVYAAMSDFGGEGAARLRARVVRAGREVGAAVVSRRHASGVAPDRSPSDLSTSDRSGPGLSVDDRLADDPFEDVVSMEELLAGGGTRRRGDPVSPAG